MPALGDERGDGFGFDLSFVMTDIAASGPSARRPMPLAAAEVAAEDVP